MPAPELSRILLFFPIVLASCQATDSGQSRASEKAGAAYAPPAALVNGIERESGPERKRIVTASQTIEVADVPEAMAQAEAMVESAKGYVESSNVSDGNRMRANLTVRIPASGHQDLMKEFAGLGRETSRRTSEEDTTDEWFDLEAKIRNAEILRSRLRNLLDRAETVEEILKIEKELSRVESDLESLRSRFERMKKQVRLAKIDLALYQNEIPGPVGAAGKAIWWSIGKLFVVK